MAIVNRLKYASGKIAIYTVDESAPNDNPLTDPLGNVARLQFHSDLPMPAVVKVAGNYKTTGSTSIVARTTNNTSVSETFTLFAHGQAGTPMVFGRITSLGDGTVPFAGSVPIAAGSAAIGPGGARGHFRWCHLGANATNVILRVRTLTGDIFGGANDLFPAMTLNWEIFVTNFLLDASQPAKSDPGVLLRMEDDRITANEGQFDSLRRYLRIGTSGTTIPLPKGKTIDITHDGSGTGAAAGADPALELRYSVDGFTAQFGTSPTSFNATFTEVKLY